MATDSRTMASNGAAQTSTSVPTRRLFGRVRVLETNDPIPDLEVDFYEVDGAIESRATGANGSGNLNPKAVEGLRNRLGSVLTDKDGCFELTVDAEVAKRFGSNRLADPVVVVSAPEDTDPKSRLPHPPAERVLHVSYRPRWNAGIVEAYLIRIEQAVLDRLKIPFGRSTEPETDGGNLVESFGEALDQSTSERVRLRERLKPHLQERGATGRARAEAAASLVRGLGRTPLRGHPGYFVSAPERLAEAHHDAMTSGLARIEEYSGTLTLNLTAEEMEQLKITVGAEGRLSGEVSAADLQERLAKNSAGMDLIRIRDLPVPLPSRETLESAEAEGPAVKLDAEAITLMDAEGTIRDRVIGQIDHLPMAGQIGARLDLEQLKAALRELRLTGGPADATAFHDFHDLQVAFKHVWTHAFDQNIKDQVEAIYGEFTRLYDAAGLELPPIPAIVDFESLQSFKRQVENAPAAQPQDSQPPFAVALAFSEAQLTWNYLSLDQQAQLLHEAATFLSSSMPESVKARARVTAEFIMNHPAAAPGRLETMTLELGKMLSEPYAFDIFAPGSYNFGILVTYRQKWEPGDYQAGNLVATIPLAPGETRKFTKRKVVKSSRAEKEISKSMETQSEARTEDNRAESEIMKKASTATNFKLTSHGSFNIGIGSIDTGSEFAMDQQQHSASTKKEFHEATLKAAQEYRLERSIEVDTSVSTEVEESSSGEIANPNNEITVTYLFYELQRQYRISERLHRARPVIMVAQDVPAPHQIDEAWLLAQQWILNRVLLDDSLRPALQYLSSGFAGDEVSTEVVAATWKKAVAVAEKLEGLVSEQLQMRAALRETLISTAFQQDTMPDMPGALKVFTMGIDPTEGAREMLEAQTKAAKTRLQYVEEALSDSQSKLRGATDQLGQATREYTAALQRKFSRDSAMDALRMHVKQNILYYMQAIWDHEPPDQRFFRLYNKPVVFPEPSVNCTLTPINPPQPAVSLEARTRMISTVATAGAGAMSIATKVGMHWGNQKLAINPALTTRVQFEKSCAPTITATSPRELVEIADLDNPLGYKGNYIIFPLKVPCYLTDYMLREYVDDYFGVRDPDEAGNYSVEQLEDMFVTAVSDPNMSQADQDKWRDLLLRRLTEARPTSDDIVVPTGQLFIEALPGSHPVLEDFKLLHRAEDVLKVQAEVRHAELENLRLAARLVAGERQDPEVEKQIFIAGGTPLAIGTE